MSAGRFEEAVTVLERAATQDRSNTSVIMNLGVARAYAGDRAGAIVALEEAIRIDPTKSGAHYNLGVLRLAEGDTSVAAGHFEAAMESDPRHADSHLELAELLRRAGRCAEAVGHFRAALEVTPAHVAGMQHLALCDLRLGAFARAKDILEQGLEVWPDHLGFMDALARVLASSPDASVRDGGRALALSQRALEREERAETLETAAMAHAELGRYAEAMRLQEEALRAAQARGEEEYVAHLRENLRRYERGEPCRTPWPDFMYSL